MSSALPKNETSTAVAAQLDRPLDSSAQTSATSVPSAMSGSTIVRAQVVGAAPVKAEQHVAGPAVIRIERLAGAGFKTQVAQDAAVSAAGDLSARCHLATPEPAAAAWLFRLGAVRLVAATTNFDACAAVAAAPRPARAAPSFRQPQLLLCAVQRRP